MSKSLTQLLWFNQILRAHWWQTFNLLLSLSAIRMMVRLQQSSFRICHINLRGYLINRKFNKVRFHYRFKKKISRRCAKNLLRMLAVAHNFRLQRRMKTSKYKFCRLQMTPASLIKTDIKELTLHMRAMKKLNNQTKRSYRE